jgi:hypothetical protein
MFTRVKPLGWGFLEILLSGQMNALDVNMTRAVDGLNGGAYTLAVLLEFLGAGLKFSSDVEFNAFAANFVATDVFIDEDSTFQVDCLAVMALVNVAGLDVASGSVLASPFGLIVGVGIPAQFQGPTSLEAATTLSSTLTLSGSGHIRDRPFALNDANQTVSLADGNVFIMPNLASADRTYGVATTDAGTGSWVRFVANANTGGFRGLVNGGGGDGTIEMAAHIPIGGVTQSTVCELRFRGGVWRNELRVQFY